MHHALHALRGFGFNLNPALSTTAQQASRADLQIVVIEDRGHVLHQPLLVGVHLIASLEHTQHGARVRVNNLFARRINDGPHPVIVHDDRRRHRFDRLPTEQPALHILNRNRARIVVRLIALQRLAIVPSVAALPGEANQRIGVQILKRLTRHDVDPFSV